MYIEINKVGKINKAQININGITIITGENDTGKSTVGKLLFSMIKADNIAREKMIDFQYYKISGLFDKLKQYLVLHDPYEVKKIEFIEKNDFFKIKGKNSKFEKLKNLVNKNFEKINKDAEIKKIFEEMFLWLKYDKSFLERRKIEFQNQITYNFGGISQIANADSYVKLINKDLELYRIKFEPLIFFDKLPIVENRRVRPFLNAVFIETPLIMNLLKFFLLEKDKVDFTYPFVLRDLARELIKSGNFNEELVREINGIIKGDFIVENEQIIFRREKDFNLLNTATGIKSFGILLLLLRNNVLRNFATLLIIDEPEIHLHPKWQVKYVKILFEIYKKLKIRILITTHSPYILDAFEKLKKTENIDFYLLKDGNAELKNNDLKEIYDILGEPFWNTI